MNMNYRAVQVLYEMNTHYWNVSLNFGDQLLFLVLVLNLRFLSARCGPMAVISTKGRNMAFVCQLILFTPTTAEEEISKHERVMFSDRTSIRVTR